MSLSTKRTFVAASLFGLGATLVSTAAYATADATTTSVLTVAASEARPTLEDASAQKRKDQQAPVVQRPAPQHAPAQRPVIQRPTVQRPVIQHPTVQRPVQHPTVQRPTIQRPAAQRVTPQQHPKVTRTPAHPSPKTTVRTPKSTPTLPSPKNEVRKPITPKTKVGKPLTPTTIGKPSRATKTGIGKPPTATSKTGAGKLPTGIGRAPDGKRSVQGKKPTNVGDNRKDGRVVSIGKKPKNITVRGKKVLVIRDRRVVYRNGAFRALIGFGGLAAVIVGSQYFDPDGYVAVAEPMCGGVSPDGCRLRWQDVPTEDGGTEPQCVEYCPRTTVGMAPAPLATPVPQMVAPEPTAPVTGCEMVVFKEPNFGGEPQTVNENEAGLNEDWDKQIASLQVKAGTWDVFAEEEFGGESLRLPPGSYATLGEEWIGKISSVRCSEPAQ